MPPVSNPALVKNATPTEMSNTPVKMATASSVRLWGTTSGAGVAGAAGAREGMGDKQKE